jgi:2'-5' RNA ligase
MANWFIALPVPPHELPDEVFDSLPAGLRRFDPADVHITIAFLGGVAADAAWAAWRSAHIDAGPFSTELGAPAALGRPDRPSAFGFDLGEGGEAVAAAIHQWRDPLRRAAGLAPEQREPRPHLTLARPPRRGGAVIRARAQAWAQRYRAPRARLTLDRIALYTWADDRRIRPFQTVATCPLPCPERVSETF